jgi:hypothetical protein
MRKQIGLSVMPLEARRDVLIGLATEGDRLGYDGFFLPETWAYDVTVLLAEAAVRTERITIGSGILGIWSRSAATVAMAAATLHAISGGRFVLGLGASTPQLAEGLHDTPYEPPVPRMRRIVTQVRALLRGERIPLAVTPGARALKLNVPPAPEVPIQLAALGDASIRLAGELGDAWIPFLYPWSLLAAGVALMREGAARGGHPARIPGISASVPAVVDQCGVLRHDHGHGVPGRAHPAGVRQGSGRGDRREHAALHGGRAAGGGRAARAAHRVRHAGGGAAAARAVARRRRRHRHAAPASESPAGGAGVQPRGVSPDARIRRKVSHA